MATTPISKRPAPKFKAGDNVLFMDTPQSRVVEQVFWQEAALYCNAARWMVVATGVTAPESDFTRDDYADYIDAQGDAPKAMEDGTPAAYDPEAYDEMVRDDLEGRS